MNQLAIPLAARASFAADDYILTSSNQAAYQRLMSEWPDYGMWLYGPAHAGKSHLAAIWRSDVARIDLDLMERFPNGPGLIDPLPELNDARSETLFHLLNHMKQLGAPILIVSERPPSQTPCPLPDLASRIKALPTAALTAPDDELLRAVWFKRFADKQLQVSPAVIDYVMHHCERSFSAIAYWAERFDHAALTQQRAITIPLVKSVMQPPSD